MLNHYDVLSVDPSAGFDTIRRAWRVKVRLLHPDRHRDSPKDVQAEAVKETRRVNSAWETLRDPQKRYEYDVHLLRLRDLERARAQSERGEPVDDEPRTRLEWLSSQHYLTFASILIVVVATAFVLAGAVLLARLTQ